MCIRDRCALGLLRCEGEILLDGAPIGRDRMNRLSFATCEHSFFPNLTPRAHMEFYRMQFPRFREKRFHALMDFFQLPMGKRLRQFSTGQKNQFEVILALCQGCLLYTSRTAMPTRPAPIPARSQPICWWMPAVNT